MASLRVTARASALDATRRNPQRYPIYHDPTSGMRCASEAPQLPQCTQHPSHAGDRPASVATTYQSSRRYCPNAPFMETEMSLSKTFDINSSRSADQCEHTRRKCRTDSTSCALSQPGHSHVRSLGAMPLHRPFASARQQTVRSRQRARLTCQSGCSRYS